jgi:hypothetical protein
MEYFFGSLITIVTLLLFSKQVNKLNNVSQIRLTMSQSSNYELLKSLYKKTIEKEEFKTQSKNHMLSKSIKVIFVDDRAYWIKNNAIYFANVENKKFDINSAKKVDTHSLSKVELDKITFIVDKLTEGNKDDSGNSGK